MILKRSGCGEVLRDNSVRNVSNLNFKGRTISAKDGMIFKNIKTKKNKHEKIISVFMKSYERLKEDDIETSI